MKTNKQPKLDDLFDKARNENPVIDIHEVRTMISGKAVATAHPKKQSISITSKKLIIMGILVTAATGAWLLFSSPEAAITPQAQPIVEPGPPETSAILEPIENQTTETHVETSYEDRTEKPVLVLDTYPVAENPAPEIIKDIVLPLPKIFKPRTFTNNIKSSLVDYSDDPITPKNQAYLELDETTLRKLGFVVKENVLLYEKKNTNAGDLRIYITTEQMGVSHRAKTRAKKKDPVYPLFMSDPSAESMLMYGRGKKMMDREHLRDISPTLVPVIVYPFGKDPEAEHYFEAVFWFERNEGFIELLPEEIKTQLQSDKKAYSVQLILPDPEEEIITEEDQIVEEMPKDLMRAYVDEQVVIADQQLLEKLHIKIDKQGIHYKARSGSQSIDFDLKNNGYSNTNLNNNPATVFSFRIPATKNILLAWSSPMIGLNKNHLNIFYSMEGEGMDRQQHFMNTRRGYVALVANLNEMQVDDELVRSFGDQLVFWFEPNGSLYKLIANEDKARLQEYFASLPAQPVHLLLRKVEPATLDNLTEKETPNIQSISPLTLEYIQLKKLGIHPMNDGIVCDVKIESGDLYRLKLTKNGVVVNSDKEKMALEIAADYKDIKHMGIHPMLVTDDLGKNKRLIFVEDGEEPAEVDQNFAATLIPLLVKTGESYSATDKVLQHWRPDLIFWYEPSDEFLSLLPEEEAKEIKAELATITPATTTPAITTTDADDTKAASCKHFEVCRSVKESINSYTLFPNPATSSSQLKLDLAIDAEVSLYMADLSGQVLMKIQESLPTGTSFIDIPLDGLPAGMYLINVTTEQGDHIFQRLIKAE